MIYLATDRFAGAFVGWIEEADRSRELASRLEVLSYQSLLERTSIPARTAIFTDHDRFTPAGKDLAVQLWDTLGREGVRRFNNPSRVLNRHEILQQFSEQGINDFRVFSPDKISDDLRFPVFVRESVEHTGSLTRLLFNRRQLDRHLMLLRLFGRYRTQDLLVVEFMDSSDSEGIFRKYSAFRIGDWIQPRCLEFSKKWMTKAAARLTRDDLLREEAEFMTANPHRRELLRLFESAGITYGRMDYGIRDGRIQVWEINTNPQVGAFAGKEDEDYIPKESLIYRKDIEDSFHHHFRGKLRELLEAESKGAPSEIPWQVSPHLKRKAEREYAAWRRRLEIQERLMKARNSPGLRRLGRFLSGPS